MSGVFVTNEFSTKMPTLKKVRVDTNWGPRDELADGLTLPPPFNATPEILQLSVLNS